MKFNSLIKEAQVKVSISQLYMASLIGYKDHRGMSQVEAGSCVPSLMDAKKLEDVLESSPQILAQGFKAAGVMK